jgi:hypothetical protein
LHWKLKAAVFKALDYVPGGDAIHFQLQRHVTRNWPRRHEHLVAYVDIARKALRDFAKHSPVKMEDARFIEIGAGRDLATPLAMRLLGSGPVTAVDIARLAHLDLINHAARILAAELQVAAPQFASWDALKSFGIDYRAPHDVAADPGIGRFDAFISNEVLEHIPADALQGIFAAAPRFLTPGALSIHSIDYSDHFARDSGVSRYNFLTFGEKEWRPYNSGFQYVNRLRHGDYIGLHEKNGFTVLETDPYGEPIPPEILANLAPRFRNYAPDDLAVMRSRIVARLG